jgi:hypothetical protein
MLFVTVMSEHDETKYEQMATAPYLSTNEIPASMVVLSTI